MSFDAEPPALGNAVPEKRSFNLRSSVRLSRELWEQTSLSGMPITRAAMELGSFALVPLRPTRPDGLAIKPTVEALIRGSKPFAFVLNQCAPNVRSSRAAEMAYASDEGRLAG